MMKPRLGFFGAPKDIDAIAAAGYDCIEMQVVGVMNLDETEFRETRNNLTRKKLSCDVLDNPIPLDKCIADECFDLKYYEKFLQIGAERAAQLGVRYYIFGNGRTRSLPVEGDIEKARSKNLTLMRMLADITGERGITILLEPLAPRVSNVVLSISEALEYNKLVGKPNLGTFLDYRWFLTQKHPFSDIEKFGQFIKHVHIDCPLTEFPKRVIPRIEDGHDYSMLFQALEAINYDGIISVEANTFDDFEQDLREGMAFFKKFGLT
jgi:sugar phosphate isomerase/epimerase